MLLLASAADRRFALGIAWAIGGAILFSLPTLLTIEFWWLGFSMDPWRLALLTALTMPLLVSISYFSGFEDTFTLVSDLLDACAAYAVGIAVASGALVTLGILEPGLSQREVVGKIALQAIPASIGALLARQQLGGPGQEDKLRRERFGGQVLLMTVGAVFLSLALAAVDEIMFVAYRMTAWHAAGLATLTLIAVFVFIYGSGWQAEVIGQPEGIAGVLRMAVVGYAIALVVAAYMLWSFGRLDGLSARTACKAVVVLAWPAGLGAGAARLML